MSEEELIDTEVEQSLEDVAADLSMLAEDLEAADDEVTISYTEESVTVPTPDGDVEFEIELEREEEADGVEYELELEIEWVSPSESVDEDDDLSVE